MSEIKLKPCPFCGGKARAFNVGGWYVRCINPNCGCFNSGSWSTEKMAIDRWNTRRPMERIAEQLEDASYRTEPTYDEDGYSNDDSDYVIDKYKAIEIVKAGGIDG